MFDKLFMWVLSLPKYRHMSAFISSFVENPRSQAANGKPNGMIMKAIAWLKADALRMPSSNLLYSPKPTNNEILKKSSNKRF